MAKVKQTKMKLEIDPARPYVETIVNTCYDNGSRSRGLYSNLHGDQEKRFYIKLPQVVADALGKEEVRGNTQEEAMKLFKAAIEEFKRLKTERNKVILYEIALDPDPRADSNNRQTHIGFRITVWAGAYEETVAISGNGAKRYSYEKIDSSLEYNGEADGIRVGWMRQEAKQFQHQVPLTEANETFFKWIEVNMGSLIKALSEISSPSKLIEMVMAGRLLPLGGGQP